MYYWTLLLLFFVSCSPLLREREAMQADLEAGRFSNAEERLSSMIQKEMPHGSYQNAPNAVWMLLDRATLRFSEGQADLAVLDYKMALEAIDFFNQTLASDTRLQVALDDSI